MTHHAETITPLAARPELTASSMPNLFLIGASKAGSSALHAYLKVHPQIYMSEIKEPCYFVNQAELEEAWPIMARNPASHDISAYGSLFSGGADKAYRGEASVYYAQSPHRSGVAARIAQTVPDARIIYAVREPVSRTIAHYWQRAKEFQEPLPLDDAIRQNPIYRDTSDYAKQLSEYLKVFDRSQIHVLLAEDLRHDRRQTMTSLFDWLGIADHAFSKDELADVHVSSKVSRKQRFGFVRTLRDSAIWANAREALPRSVVDRLRDMATVSFDKGTVDDQDTRVWLRDYFMPRIDRFEEMIGRPLDVWRNAK